MGTDTDSLTFGKRSRKRKSDMVQQKEFLTFRCEQRKSQLAVMCRTYTNLALLRSSFGFPLVLLWLFYRTLTRIRSAFEVRRYMLLTDISALVHEARLCYSTNICSQSDEIGSVMMSVNRNINCKNNDMV